MLHNDARHTTARNPSLGQQLCAIADRRVWLPRWFYESLPVLYIVMGALALVSTVFNRHWSWLLPHVLLLGCFLLHLGFMVRRRRQRARQGDQPAS